MKRSMNPERKRKRKRKRDKRRRTNTQNVSYAYSSAARREYVPKQSCCNTTILIYTFIHNRVRLNSSSPLPPSLLSSSLSSASLPSFPPPRLRLRHSPQTSQSSPKRSPSSSPTSRARPPLASCTSSLPLFRCFRNKVSLFVRLRASIVKRPRSTRIFARNTSPAPTDTSLERRRRQTRIRFPNAVDSRARVPTSVFYRGRARER